MKNLSYYMSLDYQVNIVPDKDFDGSTYFIGTYEGLEGLVGTGDTEHKALDDLEHIRENWFKLNLELGRHIPEPGSHAVN